MEQTTPNYKAMRRNYLVNRRMQIKYALIIGGVLGLIVLLMEAHTFLVIRTMGPEFPSPEVVEALRSLQKWMLASGLVYMVVIPILSIFLSHKIAGPLYRLEKSIRDGLESEEGFRPIHLREGDELQGLADLVNEHFKRIPPPPKKS